MSNKELVKQAQSVLKSLGHSVSLGHCYELFSKLSGFPSHNVAKAKNAHFSKPVNQYTPIELDDGKYKFRYHQQDGTPIVFKDEITATFKLNITGSGETLGRAVLEAANNLVEEIESYGDDCRVFEHNIVDIDIEYEGEEPMKVKHGIDVKLSLTDQLLMQYSAGVNKLYDTAKTISQMAGGTLSSREYRDCLAGRKQVLKEIPDSPKRAELLAKLDEIIGMWKAALIRHNAQPRKFTEYDVETGKAVERKSYLTGVFREDSDAPGTCPRCSGPLPVGYPGALSRRDNKTEICSQCGSDEAMDDFASVMGR